MEKEHMASNKSTPDRASGLLCLGFAVAIGIEAIRIGPGTLGQPGPGLVPLIYACILMLFSVILLLRTFRSGANFSILIDWRSVLPILAVLIFYGVAIEWLGYLICTFVVIAVLLRIAITGWLQTIVFAAAATIAVDLLFVRWLNVALPMGSIFN
jgi:putative tricarboxylic transport membrane protein